MPLSPISGTLGVKRAAHLLRRATFGASKDVVDEFAALTAAQAVARLFDQNLPDAPVPLDTSATNQDWVTNGTLEGVNSDDRTLTNYFKGWFLGQMLGSGVINASQKPAYCTREKIVLFFHTHFTTMAEKVESSRALYFQNALFRLFAFDREDRMADITDEDTGVVTSEIAPTNFKELSKKLCVDNAMLKFLDGTLNVKGSPNENYAREMFELYTIGRGLEARVNGMTPSGDGDYFTFTETDVQAAARVLTGFKYDDTFSEIDQYTGLPRGVIEPNQHTIDSTQKSFSSYFDSATIDADPDLLEGGNPTEESMIDEISQLIDMIFDREETARQVIRKIYRFFVYYKIDETLDDTIIADLAATLVANDFKIQPVLEEIYQSEHFYEAVAGNEDDKFGGIIKSPLDLSLGAIALFDGQLPDYQTELEEFYMITSNILGYMENQGMEFYQPFEVAGYGAYHQFPIYNRNWISTNYLTQRYNFIRELFNQSGDLPYVNLRVFVTENFGALANDAKQLIVNLSPYLYPFADNLDFDAGGGDLTKERLRYFLQAFLQFGDYNDTAAVNQANADWASLYNDDSKYLETGEYLKRLFNAMLQTPEYQLF
ncbi:DUF1800 family protein [Fulvivirga sp. RKSG066]|uniref:DUF1800 family protein n=1 Tax=Fulvivirga aurantia TaxID=2529383 RepID=UPI0012BD744E|nr:DUF1800 family protein [Fulvivirga aurantia]MTI20720.1 DUF1800 family protein [Fulvivirga aurantia]